MYGVDIDGTDQAKLNRNLVTFGDVDKSAFQVSPDSSEVVYRADAETNNIRELYTVAIEGGPSCKLNGPLSPTVDPGTGIRDTVGSWRPTADWSHILYSVTRSSRHELFSVRLAGGPPIPLSGPLVFESRASFELRVTPDGDTVVYGVDQERVGQLELYSVPIDGGTAVKLNDALGPDDEVDREFVLSPDGDEVVYGVRRRGNEPRRLYAVPTRGGEIVRLTGRVVRHGGLSSWRFIGPSTLVFSGDVIEHQPRQWFRVDLPVRCAGKQATLVGTDAADIIVGTDGDDVIAALGGDDIVDAGGGSDLVCGGTGDDTIRGGAGADIIRGGRGHDVLRGNRGRDTLIGGPGDDALTGVSITTPSKADQAPTRLGATVAMTRWTASGARTSVAVAPVLTPASGASADLDRVSGNPPTDEVAREAIGVAVAV